MYKSYLELKICIACETTMRTSWNHWPRSGNNFNPVRVSDTSNFCTTSISSNNVWRSTRLSFTRFWWRKVTWALNIIIIVKGRTIIILLQSTFTADFSINVAGDTTSNWVNVHSLSSSHSCLVSVSRVLIPDYIFNVLHSCWTILLTFCRQNWTAGQGFSACFQISLTLQLASLVICYADVNTDALRQLRVTAMQVTRQTFLWHEAKTARYASDRLDFNMWGDVWCDNITPGWKFFHAEAARHRHLAYNQCKQTEKCHTNSILVTAISSVTMSEKCSSFNF